MPECPPGTHSMFDFCPGDCNEPITAREILEGYGLPDGVIDEVLMAHARELSEEIRSQKLEAPEGFIPRQSWVDAWNEGREAMADLIDPEVEK